jgi:hypothetical protein
MRAQEFVKPLNLTEFAPGSGDDGGGGRDEVFVLALVPSDRTKFKVRITDLEAHEEFIDFWNYLPPVVHELFDNEYPFWNAMHPLFAKLPVVDMSIEEYLLRAIAAAASGLRKKFGK